MPTAFFYLPLLKKLGGVATFVQVDILNEGAMSDDTGEGYLEVCGIKTRIFWKQEKDGYISKCECPCGWKPYTGFAEFPSDEKVMFHFNNCKAARGGM